MNKVRKFALGAVAACVVSMAPMASHAATIQLGFLLDESGSIGAANWTTIVSGLSSAINTYIPVGGPDVYEISVVTFDSAANAAIQNVVVNSVAARTALAASIAALSFNGGGTSFGPAFTTMTQVLTASTATDISASYVNFATDGVPSDNAAGIAARNAMIAAGIDNISIEGIGGGVNAASLQGSYCYPQPCTIAPVYNFPSQGFYIGVANAQAYADAIGEKIRVVTNKVPEPGTLLLAGLALAGLGATLRRKAA